MRRHLIAVVAGVLTAGVATGGAARELCEIRDSSGKCLEHEFVGKCLLQVAGRNYLDKPCNISMAWNGDFSIGTVDSPRDIVKLTYFAFVNLRGDGTAEGFWNGVNAESHAHDPLGTLTRHGACWENAHAKVCAWRK